ncbi:MAG: hypothetical protein ACO3JL_04400 [Myxococcota bacterium]
MWLPITLLGCGGTAPGAMIFTSDVVQRDTCRTSGDGSRELCVREPVTTRVRVTVIEDTDQRVILHGVPLENGTQGTLLGTRDQSGGYLFFDERRQENIETGCTLRTERTLALVESSELDAGAQISSSCPALVGRDTAVTIASAACEPLQDPPVESRRIVRRRWEPAVGCDADAAAAAASE